jgi:hypothetical protein
MARNNIWGKVITSLSNSLRGRVNKRSKKSESSPFDIFPDWFKSVFSKNADKDKETNEVKDNNKTGVDNYLARKKSHKKFTPTEYNGDYGQAAPFQKNVPFSSPDESQSMSVQSNDTEDEYENAFYDGVSYDNPVISTKPTPTSERLKVPRPGPSTFIQTARYNPATSRLNVQYTDGTIFPYYDVSPELADRILKEKTYHSPGQTMLATIFKGHGTTKADQINDIEEGM